LPDGRYDSSALDSSRRYDRIREIKEKIKPEYLEVDLVLPVNDSEEQEGGFLSPSTLAELSLLGGTLSLQFI